MHWLGLIWAIQISILNPAFASDNICLLSEYRNGFNECVPCSSCKDGDKQLVIQACTSHADTICGTAYDRAMKLLNLSRAKKRKDHLATEETSSIGKWPLLRKNQATSLKADYDDDSRSSRADIVQAANNSNNKSLRLASKNFKPNYESDHLRRYLGGSVRVDAISAEKFGFNKNGKHIKKDLSMSDSAKRPAENSTISFATVESTRNQTMAAKSKKAIKSKPKKNSINVNDHPVSIMDTKFIINGEEKNQLFSFVHPHVENHRIYLEMEEDRPADHTKASPTLFTVAQSEKRPPKPSILIKNNLTANRPAISFPVKNNTDLLQFQQLIGGLAEVLSNSSHEKSNNESIGVATVDDKNRVLVKQSSHADDYLADESDADSNDDDDKDEDDDDEDDGDDDDDEYDENDDDEDDDDEEDDDDDDVDTFNNDRLLGGNKKSFGAGHRSHSSSPDDDDEDEEDEDDDSLKLSEDDNDYGVISEGKSSNKKWLQAETEVNVEPYSSSPDWQLLMLVSVVSACLLFFVFVNVYICIYMKKWKHMKSNFEADVEDLSVRINLMQHGGLEIDDQHYIKNYMTPLKCGQTTEISSRASLREK